MQSFKDEASSPIEELRRKLNSPALRSSTSNIINNNANTNDFNVFDQVKFSAAVQMSNDPIMKFNGDPLEYIPFITMIQNTYESVIFDDPALYSLLRKH